MTTFRLTVLVVTALVGWSGAAWASGGCFSQASPPGEQNQAVVQSAERVFFARSGTATTMWIEVKYQGQAKDFGWVLPLPAVPEVAVGSRLLFDQLDARTAPVFKADMEPYDENCRDPGLGCTATKFAADAVDANTGWYTDAPAADASQGGEGEVAVLASGQTGPYTYAVIKGVDAGPLLSWLNSHGYVVPAKAMAILQMHAKKGDVFLAVKLQNGQGIEYIRPIVLTMQDADPALPMRLTSIAAVEDMSVVVTLAGPGRAVPKNNLHVVPNPVRLNWFAGATNYQQVLAGAIDEAGGHAFATEFAQPGNTLQDLLPALPEPQVFAQANNLRSLAVALAEFDFGPLPELILAIDQHAGLTKKWPAFGAFQLVADLRECGLLWHDAPLATCYQLGAKLSDAFGGDVIGLGGIPLAGLAAALLPVDAAGLVQAMSKDVVQPLKSAVATLTSAAMVTRLAMRISPAEMDRDPVFAFHPGLPTVSHVHEAAFRRVCSSGWLPATQTRLTIVDLVGSWVFDGHPPDDGAPVGNNALDPRFATAPLALRIELLEESGPPILVSPVQAEWVGLAIAGATPGKPSLSKNLLLPGSDWQALADNLPVQAVGPWPKPATCAAKQGWFDGKAAPLDQVPPTADAHETASVDAATHDANARADATGGDLAPRQPTSSVQPMPGSRPKGGCRAAPMSGDSSLAGLLASLAFCCALIGNSKSRH